MEEGVGNKNLRALMPGGNVEKVSGENTRLSSFQVLSLRFQTFTFQFRLKEFQFTFTTKRLSYPKLSVPPAIECSPACISFGASQAHSFWIPTVSYFL